VIGAASALVSAFVAAWAGQQYQTAHAAGYAVTAVLSLVAGGVLIAYGAAFQRKTRLL
jgi:hypothetical protein